MPVIQNPLFATLPAFQPPSEVGKSRTASKEDAALGPLPEWNLTDLYPAMDSPAYLADLAKAEAECNAFAGTYRGKLATLAAGDDASQALAAAVKRYEALEDLLGRIMSYAGLVYAGDTSNPVNAKFYGDTQEKLTAMSAELLFFTLELNRIDDAVLDKAAKVPPLSHWRPWIEDIRKEKPYQLADEIERLLHEKSDRARRLEPALR